MSSRYDVQRHAVSERRAVQIIPRCMQVLSIFTAFTLLKISRAFEVDGKLFCGFAAILKTKRLL